MRSLFGGEAGVLREQNFQLLLMATILVPFGNGLLSPILDSLIGPFEATPANIGLMVSVFAAPAIVVIPIAGVLADRYGRKTLLVPSLVVFGVAGTLIAFTTDFRIALLLRFFQGMGWAGLTPLVVTSIGDLFAHDAEATAQGFRHTTAALAGSAISLLAGVLVVIAWHFPFLLYAIALPIALVFYLFFDEPTRTPQQPELAADGGLTPYRHALLALARHRRVTLVLIARALPLGVWIGFVTFNSVIVVRILDGTPVQAGILFAIGSLAMATAASQAGRATATVGNRYLLLVASNLLLGLGFAVIVLSPALLTAGVGSVAAGAGIGIAIPLFRSLLTGFAPTSLRAGLVSIGSAGSRVVLTITPIVMGGLIAVLTPVVGFPAAVQAAGLTVAVVCGLGAAGLVLAAAAAPPVATPAR